MRPAVLNPVFAQVDSLTGVGPKIARPLERLGLTRVRDVLYHLPERYVHRRAVAVLDEARVGEQIVVTLSIGAHRAPASRRAPLRIAARDDEGDHCDLVYFGKAAFAARKLLPEGSRRTIAGRLDRFGQTLQIVHPDHVFDAQAQITDRIEPVYALAEGLTQPRIAALVAQSLERAPDLPEWIEPGLRAARAWPSWLDALRQAHGGEEEAARNRLAYDELLANALALALVRSDRRRRACRPLAGDGRLRAALRLPYALTAAQVRSIAEIDADLRQATPMLRLLQGDVGSGKTVVALHAMLAAVEAGAQAALLAPTELLARQHADTLTRLAAPTGINVALLTGRDKGRVREAKLMGLMDGSIQLLIGTHAIFQDAVAYRNLGLVVIDEQHRFGVAQRLMLASKGERAPHTLAMTATPIPRSLTLAQYGEMDVSRLDERPPGRQPIDTRVTSLERIEDVIDGLSRHVAGGAQAYWVCPMVRADESVDSDIAAAEARFAALRSRFGDAVVMVHGQMASEDRDAAMERFARGEAAVLVATTVIEVGVDVPNATLMIVEQAERFGLAQLHQLRGRVGRGSGRSTCLLLRGSSLSDTARERLALLRSSQDGFHLAEEDLRLRGGGELMGTRQSGEAAFRIASLEQVQRLLPVAHDDALLLMERDGGLNSPRGQAARTLLYLMERDWGVQLLRGG
ncbi:ATP-dependent DNA helicase RecG [Erythrobacteraceae bacterium CFH 75059]|uniref:ATP-dependent DNA helicase RecG n=1 Tax=Qipengyuania thermophila TaxID=2509361 RepID=UPI00101EE236|nr:ATP-dependent DNA helicase RecG [Qipengyuania thermophila]TCD05068.1 ATP-dependent DNA helicase RecG [Erythrobacteraceae bacterium CFH 75059]